MGVKSIPIANQLSIYLHISLKNYNATAQQRVLKKVAPALFFLWVTQEFPKTRTSGELTAPCTRGDLMCLQRIVIFG